MSENGVALIAQFTAKRGEEVRVESLITDLANGLRGVDGNLIFEVHTFREAPRRYFVYELYVDESAFQRQMISPLNKVFNAQVGPLIEEVETELTWLSTPIR